MFVSFECRMRCRQIDRQTLVVPELEILGNGHRPTNRQTFVVPELATFCHSKERERKPEPNQTVANAIKL